MKKGKLFLIAALVTTMGCQSTAPAQADVNVHVSVGGPRAVAYHPVYYGNYFYNTAYAPNLLFVPQLGFYVSVGLPYDLLFFNNFYYVYHRNHWYHSHYYHGPWVVVKHNRLPRAIRKHRWHKIREYSNYEYRKAHKHRWLKHRHYVHKEKRKSIRNSAYYHSDQPVHHHWKKVHKGKSDRERKKIYKVRSENERRKAYKIRTKPEKRIIHKERKKAKTWRNNADKRIVVKEKTTKTKRWIKQQDDPKKRRWADRGNKSRKETKVRPKKRDVERTIKRWSRVND